MIRIYEYGQVSNEEIFARDNIATDVEGVVAEIIANVIKNGDTALKEYAAKFDKVQLSDLEVSQQEIDEAFAAVETEFLDILRDNLFRSCLCNIWIYKVLRVFVRIFYRKNFKRR